MLMSVRVHELSQVMSRVINTNVFGCVRLCLHVCACVCVCVCVWKEILIKNVLFSNLVPRHSKLIYFYFDRCNIKNKNSFLVIIDLNCLPNTS